MCLYTLLSVLFKNAEGPLDSLKIVLGDYFPLELNEGQLKDLRVLTQDIILYRC